MSVLVIGEAVMDIIRRYDGSVAQHPGGSPANVALGIKRLGQPTRLVTMLGNDDYGHAIAQWLAEDNVDTVVVPSERTASSIATVDETGGSTYTFDIAWDLAGNQPQMADIRHVHTGSIASYIEPGASDITRIIDEHRDDVTVSFDPNIRPALIADMPAVRTQMGQMIARADIVKCSNEDLALVFERAELSGEDMIEIARAWIDEGRTEDNGPLLVMITSGKDGVIAMNARGDVVHVPADSTVDVVDTVGAGDSFMGAVIYQLSVRELMGAANRSALSQLSKEELIEIMTFAVRVADITVSRAGANPPRLHEL
ncbi:carbohydrate kinase family protein [Arcanobacterium pinnipediorum]|uniref:Carbohydrate kinase n=1 Tax=Arcanobacterium pinnipediorum TaxID=1503041 RepID=A0ABY5AHW1_9ACTO|nr:carbohydrate kinase [Arcanobacterium pinnipediorum]USR79437.1 carbohydrate kinase [Arcanobacterium pinnipediorum]